VLNDCAPTHFFCRFSQWCELFPSFFSVGPSGPVLLSPPVFLRQASSTPQAYPFLPSFFLWDPSCLSLFFFHPMFKKIFSWPREPPSPATGALTFFSEAFSGLPSLLWNPGPPAHTTFNPTVECPPKAYPRTPVPTNEPVCIPETPAQQFRSFVKQARCAPPFSWSERQVSRNELVV